MSGINLDQELLTTPCCVDGDSYTLHHNFCTVGQVTTHSVDVMLGATYQATRVRTRGAGTEGEGDLQVVSHPEIPSGKVIVIQQGGVQCILIR